jgi:tetrahydromethanopterin S-methyltransferase subunit B
MLSELRMRADAGDDAERRDVDSATKNLVWGLAWGVAVSTLLSLIVTVRRDEVAL